MTYTGNPSLSPDVQQRVLDTFFQTLDLVAEGSRQEALLGCDFVLRMDPQFAAARTLQERLRASAGAVVDTDDLRALATGAPAPAAAALPADLFADLDGLGLELPELPAGAADLHAELNGLLERRQFQELLALAEREHGAVMSDPRLLGLVQEGQSRMEAEPYVQKFLTSARTALQAGNYDEVGRLLAKARTLDASHPGIAEIAGAVETVQAALAPPPAPPADRTAGFDLGFASPDLDFGDSAGSADTESDQRIRMLLDEGQRAFDGGDAQGAIDAWSRIFLIDIDHAEASRRIEQARKVKAESERQVEEVFHDGVAHLEAGDVEAARQAFQRVLELQPGYTTAAEYLQQIEAGHVPVVSSARPPAGDDTCGSSANAATNAPPQTETSFLIPFS